MSDNAIELLDVSKRYYLGEHLGSGRSFRDTVRSYLAHRGRPPVQEIWSLRNLDLEVPAGSALGIVGRNGGGKSTLLKIVTQITQPTSGVSRTRGRIGSLLEVGTGFHHELTGRENVYLNGAVLGMTRREVQSQFDQIVDFAGVARFIDTPVKRYSSGMYMRLAFAVAAHLEVDILAVDEVLAVGDTEFQRKCLSRMSEIERGGHTLLFVSHNLDAIRRLCPRSIWLDAGRVKAVGPTAEVLDAYVGSGFDQSRRVTFPARAGDAALREVAVLDGAGQAAETLARAEGFTVEVAYDVREPVTGLDVGVVVADGEGRRILDETLSDSGELATVWPGRYTQRLTVPPLLAAGEYSLTIWLGTPYEDFAWEPEVLHFRLEGDAGGRRERVLHLGLPWRTSAEESGGSDTPPVARQP